jgi:hypothetical protein
MLGGLHGRRALCLRLGSPAECQLLERRTVLTEPPNDAPNSGRVTQFGKVLIHLAHIACRPSHTATIPRTCRKQKVTSTPRFALHHPRSCTPSLPLQGRQTSRDLRRRRSRFVVAPGAAIRGVTVGVSALPAERHPPRPGCRFVVPPRRDPPRPASAFIVHARSVPRVM